MKPKKLNPFLLAAATILAGHAHAAVLTDFSSFTQSPNLTLGVNQLTQSITTTTGVGTNSVISTATGGTGGAGQVVFLSDSYSLATVGSRISASLGSFAGTPSVSQGIGLAVASSELMPSRVSLITFQFKNDTLNELAFNTFDAFCRRLSKSGFNCLSKSGQVLLTF